MKKTFINIRAAALKALVGSLALLALLIFVLPQVGPGLHGVQYRDSQYSHGQLQRYCGQAMPAQSSTVDITVALPMRNSDVECAW